jgi:hypothetical protein
MRGIVRRFERRVSEEVKRFNTRGHRGKLENTEKDERQSHCSDAEGAEKREERSFAALRMTN